MKRFYCTVCKRIKRVRKYPSDIQDATNEHPVNRIGTCERHSNSGVSIIRNRKAAAR